MLGGQGGDVAGDVTGTERGAASRDDDGSHRRRCGCCRSRQVHWRAPRIQNGRQEKFSAGRSGRQLSRPGQCPQPAWLCRKGYHDACRRIRRSNLLTQYGRLRCLQFRSWLDAQFVGKSGPGRRVDIECFCLAARCRESAHEQGVRSLTVRVLDDECSEFGDEIRWVGQHECGSRAQFSGRQPQLLQPLGFHSDEPFGREIVQDWASPQSERRVNGRDGSCRVPGREGRVRPGQQPLELVQVHGFPAVPARGNPVGWSKVPGRG